ncbi:MAG TPA: hypothetical protein VFO50_06075 [Candidatus Limnocylindrales bacterium]|nr:hypothetical protein [Candidatus Limnocylindrales bacterium]
MLYQPLTTRGWIALIAVTIVVGVAVGLISEWPYGILAAGVAFYLASAIIRVWEHRQIRRALADQQGRGQAPGDKP